MHRLNVDIEVEVEVGRVVRGWRYDGRSGAAADSGDSRHRHQTICCKLRWSACTIAACNITILIPRSAIMLHSNLNHYH